MLPTSQKSLEQIALGRRVNIGRHLAHLNLFISNLKDRKQEVAKNSERGRLAKLRKVEVDHKILFGNPIRHLPTTKYYSATRKGRFSSSSPGRNFPKPQHIPASQGLH